MQTLPQQLSPIRQLSVLLLLGMVMSANAADGPGDELIAQELRRAMDEPDSEFVITVGAAPGQVMDFLIGQLPQFSADVVSISFDHSESSAPGELGRGSVRTVNLDDGTFLVQRFLSLDAPNSFSYHTDMQASSADVPIDYSVTYYELQATTPGETNLRVTATWRPSTRLISMFVRRAFNNSLEEEFSLAAELIAAQNAD